MEVPMPRLGSGLDLTDLGARIRSERLRRHLSLEVLSSQSGVSSSMLSDIERGKKCHPSSCLILLQQPWEPVSLGFLKKNNKQR